MSGETWDEKLSRVRSMVDDRGQTWDLSPNDQDALRQVLGMLNATLDELASLRGTDIVDEQTRIGEYVERVQAGRAG